MTNELSKKEVIIKYLKSLLNPKDLIIKLIIVIVSTLIICLLTFLLREKFIQSKTRYQDFMGEFITINIVTNPGISFGGLSNNPELAYALQSIFFIICFSTCLFMKDKIVFATLYIASIAGLCNIIDRTIPETLVYNDTTYIDCVVDYFQFKFINNSAIFNIQDMIVVCSMIALFIYILVMMFKKGKSNENNL